MTTIDDTVDLTDRERLARARFTQGLRDVADWYDEHPALPLPVGTRLSVQITPWAQNIAADEAADAFASAARALGGERAKEATEGFFSVVRSFGPVEVEVYAHRDVVCEAVVVGTETVTEDVTEVVGTRTVVRDVIEWECKPLLAQTADDAS